MGSRYCGEGLWMHLGRDVRGMEGGGARALPAVSACVLEV
jgi:hypothetical protein